MPSMSPRIVSLIFAIVLSLALAACAGGGPPKRVNPPNARVQEIAVQADGSWRVLLRVQSFSTFSQSFQRIDLELLVDGARVGRLQPTAVPRDIPGASAEVFRLQLQPGPEAVDALARFAAAGSRSLVWTMSGSITVDGRHYRNDYEGRLSPVPGLSNTFR